MLTNHDSEIHLTYLGWAIFPDVFFDNTSSNDCAKIKLSSPSDGCYAQLNWLDKSKPVSANANPFIVYKEFLKI